MTPTSSLESTLAVFTATDESCRLHFDGLAVKWQTPPRTLRVNWFLIDNQRASAYVLLENVTNNF